MSPEFRNTTIWFWVADSLVKSGKIMSCHAIDQVVTTSKYNENVSRRHNVFAEWPLSLLPLSLSYLNSFLMIFFYLLSSTSPSLLIRPPPSPPPAIFAADGSHCYTRQKRTLTTMRCSCMGRRATMRRQFDKAPYFYHR